MQDRGIRLQYTFGRAAQRGADVGNPLFELLSAVHDHGSIQQAAKALDASYRHVWGQLRHWEQVLGQPLVAWAQGQPARLTPFAQRLRWAEASARTRLTPHIEALRVELERVLDEALDGTHQVLTVFASHDLALPHLRDLAQATHRLHLDLRFAGSLDALRALAEGRCAVAGFHVPPLADARHVFARQLKPLLKPGRHKVMSGWRRTQGLVVAPGNPLGLTSLQDVAARGARFVQRQPGSGTRLLTEHLLRIGAPGHGDHADAATLSPPASPPASTPASPPAAGFDRLSAQALTEDSHVAVAAAVAAGRADAGLAVAAAAAPFGLDFVPLVEEDYFLVCMSDVLDSPAVQALRATLADARWHSAVAALPGYAVRPDSGQVLSLTRALPWWRFRAPRSTPGGGRLRA